MPADQIEYSEKYFDSQYEYRLVFPLKYLLSNRCMLFIIQLKMCFLLFFFVRHVKLPNDLARQVPKTHLMTETEWRNLGVQQSPGWVHYMVHAPEPHVLLFRRPLPDQPESTSMPSTSSTASAAQSVGGN